MEEVFAVLFSLSLVAIPILLLLNWGQSKYPRWSNFAWGIIFLIHGTWFAFFVTPGTWNAWAGALIYVFAIIEFAIGVAKKT